jgi:hypothetical protein
MREQLCTSFISPAKRMHAIATALLVCNAVSLWAIYWGVRQYPPFWAQRGAWTYVCEPVAALLVYSGMVVWLSERRGAWWDKILLTAAAFGVAAAAVDLVGLIIEDGLLFHVRGPVMQIAMMLALFTLWGIAGSRAARALGSVRAGLLAAVLSAGVCMMIAVAAALIVQLFLVRPSLADVATWGEFKRSGWSNPRAFAIANTLDSGFTHFVIAPVIAAITGGVGSLLGRYSSTPDAGNVVGV